ncbi:hypothetical protein KCP73_13220 [Salmonella enterica subsp. enterica]|nr:hypothetical protein KCP73_13220 [Salmonella enterica subsp. enterica]
MPVCSPVAASTARQDYALAGFAVSFGGEGVHLIQFARLTDRGALRFAQHVLRPRWPLPELSVVREAGVVLLLIRRVLSRRYRLNRFELITVIRVGEKAHNNTPALSTLA